MNSQKSAVIKRIIRSSVILTLCYAGAIGVVEITADLGRLLTVRQQLQTAAEAAAHAAATVTSEGMDAAAGVASAVSTAAANTAGGHVVALRPDTDIEVSVVDAGAGSYAHASSGAPALVGTGTTVVAEVVARQRLGSGEGALDLTLARYLPLGSLEIRVRASHRVALTGSRSAEASEQA